MHNLNFTIQDQAFDVDYETTDTMPVASMPKQYQVSFVQGENFTWIENKIRSAARPIILIDKRVRKNILGHLDLSGIPCYELEAVETNKDIQTVLKVCEFLTKHNANRGTMLFVIGGGIVQDIGAFCGRMYKRGIPWTFIPTTLLSQADSCLGGKTAVNFRETKNVLGLFSAPQEVCIDENFIPSLTNEDIYSGIGEMYRLLITGGLTSFEIMEKNIESLASLDITTIKELMKHSLNVKKVIVEHDEFELDIRRSMNYGHSVGHALEAASHYAIPHGQGVTIGILVENQIAYNRGLLSKTELDRMKAVGLRLVSPRSLTFLSMFDADTLLEFLMNDKKAVGTVLKLATLEKIGVMKFIDLNLNSEGQQEVSKAFYEVFAK